MPTGGGKSLCYQLPALATDDLTVVVSPLIALMRDQCARLTDLGHPAVMLASTEDNQAALNAIREGKAKLVFAAPERFASTTFRNAIQTTQARAVRRRRGPLRVRVGPRLPPGLPAPGDHHQGTRPPAHDGLHRDRDAQGRRGDRRPARPQNARAGPLRLRPPEPLLRRPPVRRRGQRRPQARHARRRPQHAREPPRDRLLRHAQVDRGDRATRQRGRLSRRPAPRDPHARAGRVHARTGRRRRRHERVRDGRGQGRRALGLALGAPVQPRGLLPGGRTRGTRRRAGQGGPARVAIGPRTARPLHSRGRGDGRAGRVAGEPPARTRRAGARRRRRPRPDPARRRRAGGSADARARRRRARPRPAHRRHARPHQSRPAVSRRDRPPLAVLPLDRALRRDRRPLPPAPAARPLRRPDPRPAAGPLLRRPRPARLAAADHRRAEEAQDRPRGRPARLRRRTGAPEGLAPRTRRRQAGLHGRDRRDAARSRPPTAPLRAASSCRSRASARRSSPSTPTRCWSCSRLSSRPGAPGATSRRRGSCPRETSRAPTRAPSGHARSPPPAAPDRRAGAAAQRRRSRAP